MSTNHLNQFLIFTSSVSLKLFFSFIIYLLTFVIINIYLEEYLKVAAPVEVSSNSFLDILFSQKVDSIHSTTKDVVASRIDLTNSIFGGEEWVLNKKYNYYKL